jgi:hypothetical protein
MAWSTAIGRWACRGPWTSAEKQSTSRGHFASAGQENRGRALTIGTWPRYGALRKVHDKKLEIRELSEKAGHREVPALFRPIFGTRERRVALRAACWQPVSVVHGHAQH